MALADAMSRRNRIRNTRRIVEEEEEKEGK
jgi:hypothetical protein